MPAFILKQPNGLFARFSTVVDQFTAYGMTEAEAVELCQERMGRIDAIAAVQRAKDDAPALLGNSQIEVKNDGLNRWRLALHTIEIIHGEAESAKTASEIMSYNPDQDPPNPKVSAKEFTEAVARSVGEYDPDVAARYNPGERLAVCPDDDAIDISSIEVSFAIPVTVTQEQYGRLIDLVNEITDEPWNTPAEGVHWLSGQGAKPQWSQMDAALLGKPADPNAPESGEPSFDDSVLCLETAARGFGSQKEREKVLRRRSKPRPPSVYNDVVWLAMKQAVQAFGGKDNTANEAGAKVLGMFNAAGFSTAFTRIAGLEGSLDGNLVRAILCGRPDVLIHEDGAHFQILYRR